MTQLFGRFTAPGAHLHVPGAPFFAAALLTGSAGITYWAVTREPGRSLEYGTKSADLPGPAGDR
jgi:hypothetical protein